MTAASNLIARVEPGSAPEPDALIHLRIKDGAVFFFDPESGARI